MGTNRVQTVQEAPRPDAESVAGQQLRRIRVARGWTQQDVAERMRSFGYSWLKSTVNRIEGGKRSLRVNELEDLAQALEVPREMLLRPLDPDAPVDLNGQPIDPSAVTVKALRAIIAKRQEEQAEAKGEELSAEEALAKLEPQVTSARKRREQATARWAALTRQIGKLEELLTSRAGR